MGSTLRYSVRRLVVGGRLGAVGELLLSRRAELPLSLLPSLSPRRGTEPKLGAWPPYCRPTPEALRSTPGIHRDPKAEQDAYLKAPLRDFHSDHEPAIIWILKQHWHLLASGLPRAAKAARRERRGARVHPASPRNSSLELNAAFKAKAAEIGLAGVGVARYDPKYHFVEYHGQEAGDRVVVGFVEQNWAAVQAAPSPISERSTFAAQTRAHELMAEMAEWLHDQGYAAAAEPGDGKGVVIHYAVESGLGQLGLNGQLLTPQAGSRCRPTLLTTNAPLEFDSPRDYGITPICDACQVCVRRCPTGAIPARRWMARGVEKAKINPARCLPVMGQAFGCAICMKVCPVQRYGLSAVTEEFERSGQILGKGSDELEQYVWPIDGQRYGSGAKPPIPRGFTRPPDLQFNPPPYQKPTEASEPEVASSRSPLSEGCA